jgi:hypothetical protein
MATAIKSPGRSYLPDQCPSPASAFGALFNFFATLETTVLKDLVITANKPTFFTPVHPAFITFAAIRAFFKPCKVIFHITVIS